jgi:ADP-ribose pyrophosphatase YjhB (NUDIX family)
MIVDGRRYRISWFDLPFRPLLEQTTQALGACFTAAREIVLVTMNDEDWTLPGGTVEQGRDP